MNVRDIPDADVREVINSILMMKAAGNMMEFAAKRYDNLTEEQRDKTVRFLMSMPQKDLILMIFGNP